MARLPSPAARFREPPIFADRRTAAVSLATTVGLVAMEASDVATRPAGTDQVADEGTGRWFAAAMAVALTAAAGSLLGPGRRPLPRSRRSFTCGLALTWSGMALNRWARWTLGSAYRPVVTVVEDHQVVAAGPYRLVRHPMYLGVTMICAGAGTGLASWPAAVAWALPPLALIGRIRVEERVLAEAIGERYQPYARSRRRLVPGVW